MYTFCACISQHAVHEELDIRYILCCVFDCDYYITEMVISTGLQMYSQLLTLEPEQQ